MGIVAVVGSANVDHVVRVPHLPRPGETVLGSRYTEHLGGKGANQAVAAVRLGASTAFLGAVGADAAGERAVAALIREGIDCSDVARVEGAATGTAVIAVDAAGENQIAVAPGANQLVDAEEVTGRLIATRPAVVLTVLEIQMAAVLAAARAARAVEAIIVLNAAPAQALPVELLRAAPLVVVNSSELATLAHSAGGLVEGGASGVLVTRGQNGVVVVTEGGEVDVPGERPGAVVDATGAGDTFAGALAAFLAEGMSLERAARTANAAAALSVLRQGARGGMPTRSELEAYLKRPPSA